MQRTTLASIFWQMMCKYQAKGPSRKQDISRPLYNTHLEASDTKPSYEFCSSFDSQLSNNRPQKLHAHLGKSSQTLFFPTAHPPPPPPSPPHLFSPSSLLHLQKFYNHTRTSHITLSTSILSFLLLLLPKMHSMDK